MKTLKIKETTLFTLKNIQANLGINAGIKLKTYDDVIQFLNSAFNRLNLTNQIDEFLQIAKEYYDKQNQK